MTNYFIIPGLGNSGPDHWQTYFEKQGSTTTLTKAENVEYKKTVNAYAAFRLATSSPNNDKIASLTGNPYLNVE